MRIVMMLLLALVHNGAAAEWVALGETDEMVVYVDPATIRRLGNLVRMWDMTDYKTAQVEASGRRHLSARAQTEYDCKDERWRQVVYNLHSGNMGRGNIVFSDDSISVNWRPVVAGSVVETLWSVACGKQ